MPINNYLDSINAERLVDASDDEEQEDEYSNLHR